MKYLLIFVSVITVCFAGYLYAQPSQQSFNVTESFDELVYKNPEKEVLATITFSQGLTAQDVVNLFGTTSLKVRAFRHSNASQTGGYLLREGESLKDALASYERDHVFFMQKRVELESGMLSVEKDPQVKEALIASSASADAQYQNYNGILITGIEVVGSAKTIADFKSQNAGWQITEVIDLARVQ